MRLINRVLILIIVSALFFSSCVTFSTLHTPETIEPGHISFNAGVSTLANNIFNGGSVTIYPEAGWRVGVVEGFDMGFKYTHPFIFSWDSKFQLYDGPVKIAFDIGTVIFPVSIFTTIDVNPMLIIGQKHWYAGVKSTFTAVDIFNIDESIHGIYYYGTTVITGISLGQEKLKLLVELNTMFRKEDNYRPFISNPSFMPALGLTYGF